MSWRKRTDAFFVETFARQKSMLLMLLLWWRYGWRSSQASKMASFRRIFTWWKFVYKTRWCCPRRCAVKAKNSVESFFESLTMMLTWLLYFKIGRPTQKANRRWPRDEIGRKQRSKNQRSKETGCRWKLEPLTLSWKIKEFFRQQMLAKAKKYKKNSYRIFCFLL